MQLENWKNYGMGLALAAVVMASGVWARGQEEKREEKPGVIELELKVHGDGTAKLHGILKGKIETVADSAKLSEYWIGLNLAALDKTALEALKLEEGLAVKSVIADSPASKCGLAQYDVLVRFGGATIKNASDLAKAVDAVKGHETECVVLRDGQEVTVKITPAKRPADHALYLKAAPQTVESSPVEAKRIRIEAAQPKTAQPKTAQPKPARTEQPTPARPAPAVRAERKLIVREAPADDKHLEALRREVKELTRQVEELTSRAKAENVLEKMERQAEELRKEIELLKRQSQRPAKKK